MVWLSQTKGSSAAVSRRSECTVKVTKRCQCNAPMVLGTISENTNIAMVMVAGTAIRVIHGLASAQIRAACAPTPMAPTVWAIVLSVRMAARGRSMLALNSSSVWPTRVPFWESTRAWLGEMLRSTASHREQRKENTSASKKKVASGMYMKSDCNPRLLKARVHQMNPDASE